MTHRVVSAYTRVENGSSGSSNINVFVRARPLDDRNEPIDFITTTEDNKGIVIRDPDQSAKKYGEVSFQFDHIFWTNSNQDEVFNSMCKSQVDHILDGYNSCCFAC